MTNLQRAVIALRWNQQQHGADFAKELGITTRNYNRFEEGKLDPETLLAVMRWLFVDPDGPAIAQAVDDPTASPL